MGLCLYMWERERERERERNIKINQDINIEKSKLGKEIVVTCSTIH